MSQAGMMNKNLQFVLTLLRHSPLKCHYVIKKNLIVLGLSFFKDVRIEKMVFKYHIKICSKNNHKEK